MVNPPRSVTLITHRRPEQTGPAVVRLIELAREAEVELRVPEVEAEKHGISEADGLVLGADPAGDTDLAMVLGGDGSILTTLRLLAGRDVPVFAINFGAIGFLATVERTDLDEGIRRALTGDFDVLPLPALVTDANVGSQLAVNDISFHRRPGGRVAELEYSVEGEELGMVRCDGLVVATPAGSTGYNLANGGPVLAWGVEGYVVSFIAPHTLTARALVVGPDDVIRVGNLSQEDVVEVTTDGHAACSLAPGQKVEITFEPDRALLAQVAGASFYHRMRDKFGRLAY